MVIEKEISISGRVVRIAKLRHEWFDFLEDPATAIKRIQREPTFADLFTFLQDIGDTKSSYPFHKEVASAAVLPVTSYKIWWNGVDSSVRNKVRKAGKSGLELREVELDREFARGVEAIYSESPVRQGRRFCYYGKNAAAIEEELRSLSGRCYFVGAYFQGEMIGFTKLFHGNNILRTVHIIAKLSQRDKPVQDALIARAVQICEQKGLPYLQYGSWSQGGLGAFKVKRGFTKLDYLRYYVPLTYRGKLLLQFCLHHGLKDRIPQSWIGSVASLRASWNSFRYARLDEASDRLKSAVSVSSVKR